MSEVTMRKCRQKGEQYLSIIDGMASGPALFPGSKASSLGWMSLADMQQLNPLTGIPGKFAGVPQAVSRHTFQRVLTT